MVYAGSVTMIEWIKQWRGTIHFLELSRLGSGSNIYNQQPIVFKGRKGAKWLALKKNQFRGILWITWVLLLLEASCAYSFSNAKKVVCGSQDSCLKELCIRNIIFESTA